MQINHEQARKLIQYNLDQSLKPGEKYLLQTHLNDCVECRSFVNEIKQVESLLLPVMKRHWNLEPAPLPMVSILEKRNSRWQTSMLLTTRNALISLVLVAFVLGAWQATRSASQLSTPMPIGVLPIPTPSGQPTSTKIRLTSCAEMLYQVRANDTLESIALKFSISKEKLMAFNNLNNETIRAKMDLLIPVCGSTPTGTTRPSPLTITFTPLIGATTSTPGG
jgi:LysM repeat protein